MKNKFLIAMLCVLGFSLSGCEQTFVPYGTEYRVVLVNKTDVAVELKRYLAPSQEPVSSEIVEPNSEQKVCVFTIGFRNPGIEMRYKILSEADQVDIADTVMATKYKVFDCDYQTNITVNADKTLTIETIPIEWR